jgi:hypothetical protein
MRLPADAVISREKLTDYLLTELPEEISGIVKFITLIPARRGRL